MLDFMKEPFFSKRYGANVKCSVFIKYRNKFTGDAVLKSSGKFDTNPPQPEASKKQSVLVWAIPVALVLLAAIAGLLLMAYRYRRLRNSFLALAARGGYSRQMDYDLDEDDDNMGITFHAGIGLCFTFNFRFNFCSFLVLFFQKVVY